MAHAARERRVTFPEAVHLVGSSVESVGVAVIAVAMPVVLLRYALERREPGAYRTLRRRLGRVILVGLEILVAGDIIRTVAVEPTFTSVGLLAAVVLIRTFLSATIEVEIEGRLPWHRHEEEPEAER